MSEEEQRKDKKEQKPERVLSKEEETLVTDFEREALLLPQLLGRDFRMPVKRGKPGGGDHWNFVKNEIQIDPLHVVERGREYALGVLAHEGSHRRISYPPNTLIRDEVWQEPGLSFTFNAIEDPRVNGWASRRGAGLRDWISTYVAKDLAPGGDLDYHAKMRERVGFVPRFSQYGSEVIGYWFRLFDQEMREFEPWREKYRRGQIDAEVFEQERMVFEKRRLTIAAYAEQYAPEMDADVRAVLEKTWDSVAASINEAPEGDPGAREVLASAKESYRIRFEKVWPEVKKLVEEDKKDAAAGQMAEEYQNDFMSGSPSADNPLSGLPPKAQKELREAMQAMMEAMAGKEGGEAKVGDEKGGGSMLVPLDDLSPETREALREVFENLPAKEKKKLREQAEELIEQAEDLLNESIRPEGDPKTAETHAEFHERKADETKEVERKEARQREEQERARQVEKLRERMEREAESALSPYERARRELQPLIDEKVRQWQAIFSPQRNPRFISGFPSGVRLDMRSGRLMQWEARRAQGIPATPDFFEQKTMPDRRDFRFTFLVDLSGSMAREGKIEATFHALVFLTEVFAKLGLDFEILGFNTLPTDEKDRAEFVFKDRTQNLLQSAMKERVKKKLDTVLREVNNEPGNGHTDDGPAIAWAAERLAKKPSHNRFLLVLSDGEPYPSSLYTGDARDLAKQVKETKRKHHINPFCIKLGRGSGDPASYYEKYLIVDDVKELAEALDNLLRLMVLNPVEFRTK